MKFNPLKPIVPGIKTLWILKFTHPEIPQLRPPADLLIPSPFSNDWYNTNAHKRTQALDYLNEIQKKCARIKDEIKDAEGSEKIVDFLKNASTLFKDLENLDDLMRDYSDFQRKYNALPPEQDPPPNPENLEEEQK
jgi:hypothetical protein